MRNILPIFGRSPFKPFQAHMETVHETLVLLRPFFTAFLAGDQEKTTELRKQIMKLEHEADLVKNDIRDHLPKSYFMPVDRRDLLALLHQQDQLADLCEDMAIVVSLREPLPFPEEMQSGLLDLVDQVVATCDTAGKIIVELDRLFESSFGGPEAQQVFTLIKQVSEQEYEVDKTIYALAKELFRREEEIGGMPLVLWQKILELLGGLANASESIGDQLRLMIYR
ncbi:MAG: TIGR00153 family protein [Acidobacteriota bacterium]